MKKPLFLCNNFSCIVKFICLVDRPFLVVSCLKKIKRWDFTEQLWLKIAVRAQGAFFKLWPKSHHFLPKKSESHHPWGGFRFNPIWNLTFFIRLKNKKQKRRLSLFLKKFRTKRHSGKQTFCRCFLSKKYRKVRFHEAIWLKIAVRAQSLFFELCLKSHLFLSNKTNSHCCSGGFRFNQVWNHTL